MIADIGIDVLLSGLYCDQMLKIADPYIQALINGIIDSVIDVTETSLFYTEAAKSAIHGAGKNNVVSETSEYDNNVKTVDDGLELYPHPIRGR